MKKKDTDKKGSTAVQGRVTTARYLRAVPNRNQAMETQRGRRGAVVSIPLRRPGWLVPPLSWLLPYSSHRRVQLDDLGMEVLDLCDGRRSIEKIIESFAASHKLSFREAQLAVTTFLRQLTQRGLIAIVGLHEEPER